MVAASSLLVRANNYARWNLVNQRLFALQFKVQATKGIADGATRGLRFGYVLRARIRRSGR
jgi:hypothetical protein